MTYLESPQISLRWRSRLGIVYDFFVLSSICKFLQAGINSLLVVERAGSVILIEVKNIPAQK